MWKRLAIVLLAVFLLAGSSEAANFSFTIGTDDFYLSVGNNDYLPYAYADPAYPAPRISFYEVFSDYGSWVYVSPFGRVWRPYVHRGWRPYIHGHWVYTSHGPTWVGYEPWAWAGYHYGNWIFSQRFGWVWVPGYDWHPGRVAWSHGHGTLGWMPAPPRGYDYSRGYISFRGDFNQFSYYDDDFGYGDDDYGYQYGGPYYDPRYRDLYYNPGYRNVVVNLWVFIDVNHYDYDNYADYYLDADYTRTVFERRVVRINSRSVDRVVMKRIVRKEVREVAVRERFMEADNKKIRVIVAEGEDERIRKNANKVVKQVIAPGFVENRKTFKGTQAKNQQTINKIFKQENKRPQVKTINSDDVVREAKVENDTRELRRKKIVSQESEKVVKVEKEGKIKPAKARADKKIDNDQSRKPKVQQNDRDRDVQKRIETESPSRKVQDRDKQFQSEPKDTGATKKKEREDQFKGSSQKQQQQPVRIKPNEKNSDQQKQQQIRSPREQQTLEQKEIERKKNAAALEQAAKEEQEKQKSVKKKAEVSSDESDSEEDDKKAAEKKDDKSKKKKNSEKDSNKKKDKPNRK